MKIQGWYDGMLYIAGNNMEEKRNNYSSTPESENHTLDNIVNTTLDNILNTTLDDQLNKSADKLFHHTTKSPLDNTTDKILNGTTDILLNDTKVNQQNITQTPSPDDIIETIPVSTPTPNGPFVVAMTVSIPMSIGEFDIHKQESFKTAIATTGGVLYADVSITKVNSIVEGMRRRLLVSSTRIQVHLNTGTHSAAVHISSKLNNFAMLNANIQQNGLPSIGMIMMSTTTHTNAPKVNPVTNSPRISVIVSILACATFFVIVFVVCYVISRRKVFDQRPMRRIVATPGVFRTVEYQPDQYQLDDRVVGSQYNT